MDKKNTKLTILKNALFTRKKLSINDIQSLLQCNRSNAYNYLHLLTENGITLTQEKVGRTVYYSWSSPSQQIESLIASSKKTVRKFLVLNQLRNIGPLSINEILISLSEAGIDIGIGKTQFTSLVKELLNEGLIITKTDSSVTKYAIFQDTILWQPNYQRLQDQLYNLYFDLLLLPDNHAFSESVKSILYKLQLAIGDSEVIDDENNPYLIYGSLYHQSSKTQKEYSLLSSVPYAEYNTLITYKANSGQILTVKFAVGLVIYSVQSDRLTLLGKQLELFDEPFYCDSIINVSSIQNISYTQEKNIYYESSYFNNIANKMLEVSVAPPSCVEVLFDNLPYIKDILKTLQMQRKDSAIITMKENKILLTDTICGLEQFAHFLRRFEDHCQVLSPPELISKMQLSLSKSLDRYLSFQDSI